MTCQDFRNYSVGMEAELKALEEKIGQLAAMCRRLHADNRQLHQRLAATLTENKQLSEKIGAAKSNLENLLAKIPEGES